MVPCFAVDRGDAVAGEDARTRTSRKTGWPRRRFRLGRRRSEEGASLPRRRPSQSGGKWCMVCSEGVWRRWRWKRFRQISYRIGLLLLEECLLGISDTNPAEQRPHHNLQFARDTENSLSKYRLIQSSCYLELNCLILILMLNCLIA